MDRIRGGRGSEDHALERGGLGGGGLDDVFPPHPGGVWIGSGRGRWDPEATEPQSGHTSSTVDGDLSGDGLDAVIQGSPRVWPWGWLTSTAGQETVSTDACLSVLATSSPVLVSSAPGQLPPTMAMGCTGRARIGSSLDRRSRALGAVRRTRRLVARTGRRRAEVSQSSGKV